jgi:hypothetical protein
MEIFTVGIITLFAITVLFYIVLFSFIYYWHLTKITFIVLPVVFTFEFFAICFFIVCLVSIAFTYIPVIINVTGI